VTGDNGLGLPEKFSIEYKAGDRWMPATVKRQSPAQLTANTGNTFVLAGVQTSAMRIRFTHSSNRVAITEFECYR
jgi:hypothetical protein